VKYTNEHHRRIAERCLRMAEFGERAHPVTSLRQIATDYFDMADGTDCVEPLRTGHEFPVRDGVPPKARMATVIYATIKNAIRSAVIVACGILVGVSVFAAMILAIAPAGASITSVPQIECMYRQMANLKWPRDLLGSEWSLNPLQKACGRRAPVVRPENGNR